MSKDRNHVVRVLQKRAVAWRPSGGLVFKVQGFETQSEPPLDARAQENATQEPLEIFPEGWWASP